MKASSDTKPLLSQILAELASTRPKLKDYVRSLPREAHQSLALRQTGESYVLSHLMRVPAPPLNQAGDWVYKPVSYTFR